MIVYLVTADNAYTMGDYLQSWGRALEDRVCILPYEKLSAVREFPDATYLFSDLERLTPPMQAAAAGLWQSLGSRGDRVLRLNNPGQVMSRVDLLTALSERGENAFRIHPATDAGIRPRFPVFVRHAREHLGSFTGLIGDHRSLTRALGRLVGRGWPLRDLIIVEFCDTQDTAGVYRKYAAFRVGRRIIPRHLIFSHNWVLKYPTLLDERLVAEENDYVETNPHRQQVEAVFDLAGIDYGRIDYSMLDGRLQAWEVNTNPIIFRFPEAYDPLHIPAQERFSPRIRELFEKIDRGPADAAWKARVEAIPLLRARLSPCAWVRRKLQRASMKYRENVLWSPLELCGHVIVACARRQRRP
ncbi:MAG: hypothetical protein HZA91_12420 [Verrucomicrobia bacterium]|nr:hypothetical protein [Verrucomicrobiota bacterium]